MAVHLENPDFHAAKKSLLNPDKWVDLHADCLFRYALVRVREKGVAEDLVQDTFVAALKNKASYTGASSERTWLCGILNNKIATFFRQQGRERSFTDIEFLSGELAEKFIEGGWIHSEGPTKWKPDPEAVAHRDEFWVVLNSCLRKLPQRVAAVFMMRTIDEAPAKEVCATLSISEANFWVMMHRARMALRECLQVNWFKN